MHAKQCLPTIFVSAQQDSRRMEATFLKHSKHDQFSSFIVCHVWIKCTEESKHTRLLCCTMFYMVTKIRQSPWKQNRPRVFENIGLRRMTPCSLSCMWIINVWRNCHLHLQGWRSIKPWRLWANIELLKVTSTLKMEVIRSYETLVTHLQHYTISQPRR